MIKVDEHESKKDNNETHKEVPQKRKLEGEANFTFIFLENIKLTTDFGEFKVKTMKTKYLEDVMMQFDEIVHKDNTTQVIVVSHNKLVRSSGSVNTRKVQALVGYAVSHGYLRFKSSYEREKGTVFSLSLRDRPMINTGFEVIAVDLHCAKDI